MNNLYRFILFVTILFYFLKIPITFSQTYLNNSASYEPDTLKNKITISDTNSNNNGTTFISLAIGASTFKFVNLGFFEANLTLPIGQDINIITGISYYKEINYDPYQTAPTPFNINLYLSHNWNINDLTLSLGGGFNFSFLSLYPKILVNINYKLTKYLYSGIGIQQFLIFGQQKSKYFSLPFISIHFIIKL